ncbi:MAG: nuclear transport factor 2 family protein [Bdellovibrionales bacterium]|nr:nuclear transport factor 2 family protein [Bdellovibrionales bacterium]
MRTIAVSFCLLISISAWGQSMKDLSNKDRIKFFYEKLSKDSLQLVDEFYHPQVEFIDPVGPIKGADKIKKYYANMYANVKTIKFDFSEYYESGNNVVAVWKMTLQTDKLNSGETFSVDGNSVIKFDDSGKAIYHRDYFDMGAFIYEKIPVVGFVVKKIKERMKAE